jgi:hypothetical protein
VVKISAMAEDFSLLHTEQIGGDPSSFLTEGCPACFPGVNRPRTEYEHHFQVVPRLRLSVNIPPFHHTPSLFYALVGFLKKWP